jgi:CRP-like cAMP-binding protein
MDTSSFFQYPGATNDSETAMVFLEYASEQDWTTLLASAETDPFKAGQDLISIGERDDALYIVQEGQLEVLVQAGSRMRRLTVLNAGSVFGEQAFFDRQPRSATIRAVTDGGAYRISRKIFNNLAAKEPELAQTVLFDLGRILSLRLREATKLAIHRTG